MDETSGVGVLDKAAAVRMYEYVHEAWAEHRAELQAQHDALPQQRRRKGYICNCQALGVHGAAFLQ